MKLVFRVEACAAVLLVGNTEKSENLGNKNCLKAVEIKGTVAR